MGIIGAVHSELPQWDHVPFPVGQREGADGHELKLEAIGVASSVARAARRLLLSYQGAGARGVPP